MVCKVSLKNIKKYRKLKRYTQLTLGVEIGVSDATISRLENDREKSPKLDVIVKIGEVLDMCPFDLMCCDCDGIRRDECKECKGCNKKYERYR